MRKIGILKTSCQLVEANHASGTSMSDHAHHADAIATEMLSHKIAIAISTINHVF
ncbi:MAG: hypothetical protein ACHQNE_01730 [Candidatus Kapaibacterium sp.]